MEHYMIKTSIIAVSVGVRICCVYLLLQTFPLEIVSDGKVPFFEILGV